MCLLFSFSFGEGRGEVIKWQNAIQKFTKTDT